MEEELVRVGKGDINHRRLWTDGMQSIAEVRTQSKSGVACERAEDERVFLSRDILYLYILSISRFPISLPDSNPQTSCGGCPIGSDDMTRKNLCGPFFQSDHQHHFIQVAKVKSGRHCRNFEVVCMVKMMS